jgi:hypothetical protein
MDGFIELPHTATTGELDYITIKVEDVVSIKADGDDTIVEIWIPYESSICKRSPRLKVPIQYSRVMAAITEVCKWPYSAEKQTSLRLNLEIVQAAAEVEKAVKREEEKEKTKVDMIDVGPITAGYVFNWLRNTPSADKLCYGMYNRLLSIRDATITAVPRDILLAYKAHIMATDALLNSSLPRVP